MTTYSSPDDEITGTEDIIRISDVRTREASLRPWRIASYPSGEPLETSFHTERAARLALQAAVVREDEDVTDELDALKVLLNEIPQGDVLTALRDARFLVSEDYLEEFAEKESGLSQDSPAYGYVDWARMSQDMTADMTRVTFRDSVYWIRPV